MLLAENSPPCPFLGIFTTKSISFGQFHFMVPFSFTFFGNRVDKRPSGLYQNTNESRNRMPSGREDKIMFVDFGFERSCGLLGRKKVKRSIDHKFSE